MAVEHGKHQVLTENDDQKSMKNAYSINQSDTLPLHFMNKPFVNNLFGRGTELRVRIWYNSEHIYYILHDV